MLHIVYARGPVSDDQDFFGKTRSEKRDVFTRRLVCCESMVPVPQLDGRRSVFETPLTEDALREMDYLYAP